MRCLELVQVSSNSYGFTKLIPAISSRYLSEMFLLNTVKIFL